MLPEGWNGREEDPGGGEDRIGGDGSGFGADEGSQEAGGDRGGQAEEISKAATDLGEARLRPTEVFEHLYRHRHIEHRRKDLHEHRPDARPQRRGAHHGDRQLGEESHRPETWGDGGGSLCRSGRPEEEPVPWPFADREDGAEGDGLDRGEGENGRGKAVGRHHEAEPRPAEHRADIRRAIHHPAGPLALVPLEHVDGEGVDRHVLKGDEDVVEEDEPAEERGVAAGPQEQERRDDHHRLREDQPRSSAAQAPAQPGVDHWPPQPLEAPGENGHGDDVADGVLLAAVTGQPRCQGHRHEAVGDPLGDIDRAAKNESEKGPRGEGDGGVHAASLSAAAGGVPTGPDAMVEVRRPPGVEGSWRTVCRKVRRPQE